MVIHKLLAPVFGLPNGNTRSGLYNMNSALHCVMTVNDIVWVLDIRDIVLSHVVNLR